MPGENPYRRPGCLKEVKHSSCGHVRGNPDRHPRFQPQQGTPGFVAITKRHGYNLQSPEFRPTSQSTENREFIETGEALSVLNQHPQPETGTTRIHSTSLKGDEGAEETGNVGTEPGSGRVHRSTIAAPGKKIQPEECHEREGPDPEAWCPVTQQPWHSKGADVCYVT